ncbi:MAG: DUF1385 domain-containing protein [Eubacteriales bacterium]
MDFSKIFLEKACPTSIGGQAIIEGIMMRGSDRTAIAVRMPDGAVHLKTEKLKAPSGVMKIPLIRGVFSFASAMVIGTKTLMYSADVLEQYEREHTTDVQVYEKDKFTLFLEKHFGEKGTWNFLMYFSAIIAVLFSVAVFILLPTALANFFQNYINNDILLNLGEGIFRIVLFVIYVILISKMPDIRRVFQFHGAEHKCIHCFENNLELTPKNCQGFYTLHPRCGTSFLMFVMIISLILFSLLGWPNLIMRVTSRLLLLPIIAGLSYEVLKLAGRSSSTFVKILSLPGLYLQKITTKEPDEEHLEMAIIAMKAVLVPKETPEISIYLPSYDAFNEKDFLGESQAEVTLQ